VPPLLSIFGRRWSGSRRPLLPTAGSQYSAVKFPIAIKFVRWQHHATGRAAEHETLNQPKLHRLSGNILLLTPEHLLLYLMQKLSENKCKIKYTKKSEQHKLQ